MWWLPIVSFFGRLALKIGLRALEKQHPGSHPIIDQIIKWLEGQAASGNQTAVEVLKKHVSSLCDSSVIGCAPSLKN